MAKNKDFSRAEVGLAQVRSQYPVINRLKEQSRVLENEKAELKQKGVSAASSSSNARVSDSGNSSKK